MNAYTIEFHVACPVNGVRVKYTLRIETPARLMLPVEQLVAEIEAIEGEPAFHEDLADRLASKVLYPAIDAAMKELRTLQPGFNVAVDRAFNHLHRAFWSECPRPVSADQLRPLPDTAEA